MLKKKGKKITEKKRIPLRFIAIAIVVLFVIVAFAIRVIPPYDEIFTDNWVKFASGDTYYYMRLVDNMTRNFPHLMATDPYLLYPDGQGISGFSLFARIIAGVCWLAGLGHPTQQVIDIVSAYVPAVMGALVVVPVYFIGKELAGRWTGLVACALVAVLPGEFLGRSLLGSTDHHVAEVLFSTTAMLFLVMAVKKAKERSLSFNTLLSRESAKPIVYGLLAGLFLGLYLVTWIGGLLLVLVLMLYFVAQFIISHFKREPVEYLLVVGGCCLVVASLMFLPTNHDFFSVASMACALSLPFILWYLSRYMKRYRLIYYPLAILGIGGIGLLAFRLANPAFFDAVLGNLSIFAMGSRGVTTIEMQPLLFPNGVFTLEIAWGNFGLAFFIALGFVFWLACIAVRNGDSIKLVVVVWSFVILLATLGQRRFAYYLAVNVALLSGYVSWLALKWAGLKEWQDGSVNKEITRKTRHKNRKLGTGWANIAVTMALVFLALFLPIIPSTSAVASNVQYAPSDAWCESLDWLRENSYSPFPYSDNYRIDYPDEYNWGDPPNTYYRLRVDEKATYAVLSWWDYGYWITRIAHRVPDSNPSQSIKTQIDVATILTSSDESEVGDMSQKLGSEYVVLDFDTVTGKYWAMLKYADKEQSEYFDIYYIQNGNQMTPVQLFYPRYYQSFAVRLYNFDGKAVQPQNVVVISYENKADMKGTPFKLLTDAKQFGNYEDAERFVSENAGYRIVSDNPFVSPLPLDVLENYALVYSSSDNRTVGDISGISEVKIFKYLE